MSRSNHFYFNIDECRDWHTGEIIRPAKPLRSIDGRRNWTRREKIPRLGHRYRGEMPPLWFKRMLHKKVRREVKRLLYRDGSDAVIPNMEKWAAGRFAWWW